MRLFMVTVKIFPNADPDPTTPQLAASPKGTDDKKMLQWLTCACVIGSIGEQLGWSEAGLASPSAVLNFTVSLRQQNLYELERRALAISDPTSALYGKFMSEKEIRALAAVREEDVQIATSWLQASGVTSFVAHHEQIQVSTSVAHASALLQTNFIRLVHTELGERIVSVAEEYVLPREVHAVLGLSGLPLPAQPVLVMSGRDVVAKITPAVLEAAYSVRGVKVERGGNSTHRQAVAEFQQSEYMSADDVRIMLSSTAPHAQLSSGLSAHNKLTCTCARTRVRVGLSAPAAAATLLPRAGSECAARRRPDCPLRWRAGRETATASGGGGCAGRPVRNGNCAGN
jgi:hypothetical protein